MSTATINIDKAPIVPSIPKDSSAVIVVHIQSNLLTLWPGGPPAAYLNTVSDIISQARRASLPIIWTAVSQWNHSETYYSKFYQDISFLSSPALAHIKWDHNSLLPPIEAGYDGNQDLFLTDPRGNIMNHHKLISYLKEKNIHNLLICGGITSKGIMLATIPAALDNYQVFILADGCIDPDPETHKIYLERVLPVWATVISNQQLHQALAQQ